MVTRSEAILYAVLERSSRSPDGHLFKSTAGVTQALASRGLVTIREDGRVVITDKGWAVFRVLDFKVEQNRQNRKPGGGLKPHRKARLTRH